MAVVCEADKAEDLAQRLEAAGETVFQIGQVVERSDGAPAVLFHGLQDAWPDAGQNAAGTQAGK